jgi:hypothetical protein
VQFAFSGAKAESQDLLFYLTAGSCLYSQLDAGESCVSSEGTAVPCPYNTNTFAIQPSLQRRHHYYVDILATATVVNVR